MAYLRDLKQSCQYCGRNATKELVNRFNSPCGRFCSSCARAELKRLLRSEKSADAASKNEVPA